MNELTAPHIRFRHAAAAIGVNKKTLRNWLARNQVTVRDESDGWLTFSLLDLVRLSLTAELVRYGVGVVAAFVTAGSQVSGATFLLERYKNTPAGVIIHAFSGWRLFAHSPAPGKWSFIHARPLTEPEADWGGASRLVIEMDVLVSEMITRLANIMEGSADADGDEENEDDQI